MSIIIEKLRNTRILAIIGIVCLFLGTIISYVKFSLFGYSIYSISLLKYWPGKLIFVLVIANALFLFKDLIEKYIPTLFNNDLGKKISQINNPKLSLIPTILVAAFAIYLHIHLDLDSSYVTYSLGFYSLWLGIICLVLYAVFHKKSDINIM